MNATVVIANPDAPIRKYDLGGPMITREQRIAFERIHCAIAQTWSDSMAEYLPGGAALEFKGFDLDALSSVPLDDNPCAQLALFSIGSTSISGFLMTSGTLAKFLVSAGLGLDSTADEKTNQPFTRIEATIAREMTRAMLARLGEAYAGAGLGSIANLRECENLADSFLFAPDESLALLRFGINCGGDDLRLLIGLSSSIIGTISEHQASEVEPGNGRRAIAEAVSQVLRRNEESRIYAWYHQTKTFPPRRTIPNATAGAPRKKRLQ